MTAPKWAVAARARDELILRTLAEMPEWWDEHVEPRLEQRGPCILWSGATDSRYGVVALPRAIAGNTVVKVHRASFLRTYGEIGMGLTLDHICMIRTCCNVGHLEVVTQQEQTRRAAALGLMNRYHQAASGGLLSAYLGGVA